MEIYQIKPLGYCFGVIKAIEKAKKIKDDNPNKNIYIFGMIVHNNDVCAFLSNYGITTIDTTNIDKEKRLNDFSKDDIVIFTAHGHDKKYETILKNNHVEFYDATCVKVEKNEQLIREYSLNNDVIYIGKKGHPETDAALSISSNIHLFDIKDKMDYSSCKSNNPLIVNQTTLSFLELEQIHKELKEVYPNAKLMDEICNATRLRQNGIKNIPSDVEGIIVIGSRKSSNTDKLYILANEYHKGKYIIKVENLNELLKDNKITKFKKVAIVSGTSTPLKSIEEIETYLGGINNGI